MSENTAYPLPAADRYALEQDRLSRQFEVIQEFIGRLTFAPLDGLSPKSILELGSGTGAWAAEAADKFPDATVLAVDLVNPRPELIRPNMRFQTVDLRESLPWEAESFDVVHTRLTLMHVPNGREVLLRILPLVKKGGILILEDASAPIHHAPELVPGFMTFWRKFQEVAKSKRIDLDFPGSYTSILKDSGMFNETECRVEFCTYSEGDDTPLGRMSAFSRESFQAGPLRHYPGTSPELIKQVENEMADPSVNKTIGYNWYFVWGRRA